MGRETAAQATERAVARMRQDFEQHRKRLDFYGRPRTPSQARSALMQDFHNGGVWRLRDEGIDTDRYFRAAQRLPWGDDWQAFDAWIAEHGWGDAKAPKPAKAPRASKASPPAGDAPAPREGLPVTAPDAAIVRDVRAFADAWEAARGRRDTETLRMVLANYVDLPLRLRLARVESVVEGMDAFSRFDNEVERARARALRSIYAVTQKELAERIRAQNQADRRAWEKRAKAAKATRDPRALTDAQVKRLEAAARRYEREDWNAGGRDEDPPAELVPALERDIETVVGPVWFDVDDPAHAALYEKLNNAVVGAWFAARVPRVEAERAREQRAEQARGRRGAAPDRGQLSLLDRIDTALRGGR